MSTIGQIEANLQQPIDGYQSHRPATPEPQLPQHAHPQCRGAGHDLPLRRSCSAYPRAFAQLQHRNNSGPASSAAGVRSTTSNSLTPNYFLAKMGSFGKLLFPPRSAPPPPFPPCHNERLNAAGYPPMATPTRQVKLN
jgi:hypothetical protein